MGEPSLAEMGLSDFLFFFFLVRVAEEGFISLEEVIFPKIVFSQWASVLGPPLASRELQALGCEAAGCFPCSV